MEQTAPSENGGNVRISVVIPTYNSVRFLKESIDSVIAQEHPAHEILVVDGASTDGTRELCQSFGKRVSFIQQGRNEGVASALNLGLRRMSGDWFKEHDADDVLESSALKVLSACAGETGAQVVYGDFLEMDTRGRLLKVNRAIPPEGREDFIAASWRVLAVSHLSAMVSRSCFETVGPFDDTLESAEDYDWFARAALVHGVRFAHVPLALSRYRKHPEQTTHWRRKGRILITTRMRTEAKLRLLLRNEAKPQLVEYYGYLTRKFRRTYLPLLMMVPVLKRFPRHVTMAYFATKMAPGVYNRAYWAANPPWPAADH